MAKADPTDTSDLLEHADRLCLETARRRGGFLEAVISRRGVEDRDEVAMRDHFEAMVRHGLLRRVASSARPNAHRDRVQQYEATELALTLLAAVERIEQLAARQRAKLTPARRR